MERLFTDTNGDGENVLLLDYTSQWTIKGNPEMHIIGDKCLGGYEITGDAVDRFAELERSAPRWISVKDKLPEKGQDVLVYDGFCIELGCYDPDYSIFSDFYHFWDGTKEDIQGVTHWMKLPAPPAE